MSIGFLEIMLLLLATFCASVAAVYAMLGYRRANAPGGLTKETTASLLRSETDILRVAIQEQASWLRQELGQSLTGFQEMTVKTFGTLRDGIDSQIRGFGERLNDGIKTIGDSAATIAAKLNDDMAQMRIEANASREHLRSLIEQKLDQNIGQQVESSKNLRDELGGNFDRLGNRVAESLTETSAIQKERLENVTGALGGLTERLEKAQEGLRSTVEAGLERVRGDNAEKLEQIRLTVDEKLQGTLEQRLGASFKLVSEQLEQVFRSVGEMQTLATGVGDLKRVLTSVKLRGNWGEVSLGGMLEQVMAPDQYERNVEIKPGSNCRVEYAIKLPGVDDEGPLWLPIDAKFPTEDYERLVEASERGDVEAVESASKALELRIRSSAKDICDKYVCPPHSTDFGILFLATEGLFAEIVRRPGLVDSLQRECRIVVTGQLEAKSLLGLPVADGSEANLGAEID